MLEQYGLETEFPERWTNAPLTDALGALDGADDGALVDELLSSIATGHSVAADEQDPLGSGRTILQLLGHTPNSSSERAQYIPSSTSFDARKFLNDVHSRTSLADLERGLQALRQAMRGNEFGLRKMADTDYEQFVATKRQLDLIMEQLRGIGIRRDCEFGLETLEQRVGSATNQLALCARPLDGVNAERQRLQNALKSLEANRRVLELPQVLTRHFEQGEHDQFVREYKRGTRRLETMLSSRSRDEHELAQLLADRAQHVLHTYRDSVRAELLKTCADGAYAPLLTKLMDLGVQGNPAFEWLEHNIKRFKMEIESTFTKLRTTTEINAADSQLSGRAVDLAPYLRQLKPANVLEVAEQLDEHEHVDAEEAVGQWEQLAQLFDILASTLNRASLFYREFVSLTQNSTAATSALGQLSQRDIDLMTRQCHALVSTASQLLTKAVTGDDDEDSLPFMPLNSNSLAVAKYLGHILEMLRTANDQVHDLYPTANNPLTLGLGTVKSQFVKTVCQCWARDATKLGEIQDWHTGAKSRFPEYFVAYHGLMLEKLRFLLDTHRGGPASQETVSRVAQIFPAALSLSVRSVQTALKDASPASANQTDAKQKLRDAKLQPATLSQDAKLLTTLNHFEELRHTYLEQLYDQFETVVKQPAFTHQVRAEVGPEVEKIAAQLFDVYIRKKRSRLSQVVHQETLRLRPLWRDETLEVRRVSNYIYECLMVLVDTHALFTESCPQLARQAVLELYSNLLTSISSVLREVDALSRYGTLQNVADLEFMRWAMSQLPETKDLCLRIFDAIKCASTDDELWRSPEGARGFVMPVLEEAIRQSQFAFVCFKSLEKTQ